MPTIKVKRDYYPIAIELQEATDESTGQGGIGTISGFFPVCVDGKTKGRVYGKETINTQYIIDLQKRCDDGSVFMRAGHPSLDPNMKKHEYKDEALRRVAVLKSVEAVDGENTPGIKFQAALIDNEYGRNLKAQIKAGGRIEISPNVAYPLFEDLGNGKHKVKPGDGFTWKHFDWVSQGEFDSYVSELFEEININEIQSEGSTTMPYKNMAELKESQPELFEAVFEQAKQETEKVAGDALAVVKEESASKLNDRDAKIAELTTVIYELTKTKETVESELASAKEKLSEIEKKEAEAQAKVELTNHITLAFKDATYGKIIQDLMKEILVAEGVTVEIEDHFKDKDAFDRMFKVAKHLAEKEATREQGKVSGEDITLSDRSDIPSKEEMGHREIMDFGAEAAKHMKP